MNLVKTMELNEGLKGVEISAYSQIPLQLLPDEGHYTPVGSPVIADFNGGIMGPLEHAVLISALQTPPEATHVDIGQVYRLPGEVAGPNKYIASVMFYTNQ